MNAALNITYLTATVGADDITSQPVSVSSTTTCSSQDAPEAECPTP
jgi:hypothetical protein